MCVSTKGDFDKSVSYTAYGEDGNVEQRAACCCSESFAMGIVYLFGSIMALSMAFGMLNIGNRLEFFNVANFHTNSICKSR